MEENSTDYCVEQAGEPAVESLENYDFVPTGALECMQYTGDGLPSLLEKCAAQRQQVEDVREDVEDMIRVMLANFQSIGRGLTSLEKERQSLIREKQLMQESLQDKQRQQDELRAQVETLKSRSQSGDAQLRTTNKTLEDQVAALRRSEAALQAQVQQAQDAEREMRAELGDMRAGLNQSVDVQRQLSAVRADAEAKSLQIARLQEELEEQAKAHEARTSQLQESFQTKMKDLRRVHEEQLAERTRVLAVEKEEALARASAEHEKAMVGMGKRLRDEIAALEAKLSASEAKQKETQAELARVTARLKQHDAEVQALAAANESVAALKRERDQLQHDKRKLEDTRADLTRRVAELERTNAELAAGAGAGAGSDEIIELMESRLLKLSEIIRNKETEIAGLRETVQVACAERQLLIEQFEEAARVKGRSSPRPQVHSKPASREQDRVGYLPSLTKR